VRSPLSPWFGTFTKDEVETSASPTSPKDAPPSLYIWHKGSCEYQELNFRIRGSNQGMQCIQGWEDARSLKTIMREEQTN